MKLLIRKDTIDRLIKHIEIFYLPRIKEPGILDRCKIYTSRLLSEIPEIGSNPKFIEAMKKIKEARHA